MSRKLREPFAILPLLFILLQGCQIYSSGLDFVHDRYINTVAYFNTYYNAKKAFEDAEKQVLDQQQTLAASAKPASQNTPPPIPGDAKTKFNTAIEKCSKLLTFYPTSKWVDDALFMIGKSYFYLDDDLHAERKFLELFAKFPNSGVNLEAELWYGRCLLRQKRFDEGERSLDQLYTKAASLHERGIAGSAASELGKHYFAEGNPEKAITYFLRSVQISNDDQLNGDSQLRLGYCYRQLGDHQKAERSFASVDDYSPDYATAFTAKFEHTRTLVQLQKYPEALNELDDLASDAKNSEYFPRIQLEIGRLNEAQGNLDLAIKKYSYVDTAYGKTDEAAQAYFRLGRIYEISRDDYEKAYGFYDKSRLESASAPTTPEAARKADAFGKYFSLRKELHKYDSLIVALQGRPAHRDSVKRLSDTAPVANTDSAARADSAREALEKHLLAQEAQSVDSLRQLVAKSRFELAGIFYLELDRQDSAQYWFQRVIDEGGKSEVAERSLFTLAEIARTSGATDKRIVDSLYRLVIAQYPESPYAQESRKALGLPLLVTQPDPAESLYAEAEPYIDGDHADSALPYLYTIVRDRSGSSFSPKALYAIGWIYENKLDKADSASAVYRRLIKAYPRSDFAVAVIPKIQEEDAAKLEAEQKAKQELEAKKKEAEQKKEPDTAKKKPDEGKKDEGKKDEGP
ncbi:MAG TPA: tetratricopeptide repeat protein [Bacteroidota bacterium]|nr:tetratricopeptide repeat protein [Bacteroidota bacterium]